MSNLLKRILTAVVAMAVFFPAYFLLPAWVLLVVLSIMMLVLAYEYTTVFELSGLSAVCYMASVTLFCLVLTYFIEWGLWCALIALVVRLFLMWEYSNNQQKRSYQKVILLASSVMDVALFSVCFASMYMLNKDLLLGVLVLIWGVDIFGYLGGRLCGSTQVVPAISPNKTLEGYLFSLGWVFFLILVANLLGSKPIFLMWISLYFLSIVGDLMVSFSKRLSQVKDTGKLLPGHGGLLDRLDSWIYTIPCSYVWMLLN